MIPTIKRQTILKVIDFNLRMVYQWSDQFSKKRINVGYSSCVFEYLHKAEALIELLEVEDCGSTGGFDKSLGQDGLYSLEERFEGLKKKYKEI